MCDDCLYGTVIDYAFFVAKFSIFTKNKQWLNCA